MSYPPPSGDPTRPYEPPAGDPGTAAAPEGLGRPPSEGHPRIDYPPTPYQPAPHQPAPHQQGGYPPTAAFPGYQPGFTAAPAPGAEDPAPRRSNVPLVAVILASALLLCGGTVVTVVLVVRSVVTSAKEAVSGLPTEMPTLPPDLPGLPTELPGLPTNVPGLPTNVPGLPTNVPGLPTELPDLPTGLPGLPGLPTGGADTPGRTVRVGYEVDGDGPADITYLLQAGTAPRTIRNVKLPWRVTVSMTSISLASVVAVRVDTTPGSIRCRTTVDGAPAADRTGNGSPAVTTCSKLIID